MNIKEVKDLIQEVLLSDISEFELEHTGTRIRLRRGSPPTAASPPVIQAMTLPASPDPSTPAPRLPSPPASVEEPKEAREEDGLHFITSPIVGTFYRAASPGAEPYVKVGDVAEEGTVLCLVEAMKLMNEIPSDVAGEVARIYVENGHPVEFGQKLFGIRPHR